MEKILIEKTSKRLKLTLLLCRLAYVISPAWAIYLAMKVDSSLTDEIYPAVLFVGAIVTALVTKFLIWWHHG